MEKKNWIELICTIGPSSFNKNTLKKMQLSGVSLLRINMSHVSVKKMEEMIKAVQAQVDLPICIDTEGSQIRTANFDKGSIKVNRNDMVKLTSKEVLGSKKVFSLKPPEAVKGLTGGDLVYVDYNKVLLVVIKKIDNSMLLARVICPGSIGSNKAVNVGKNIELPDITPKDYQAIEAAKKYKINTFALSFARNKAAVEKIRAVAGRNSMIISKIETREGIANLDSIIQSSDAILIDRGDLSREVPIERIPAIQKMIISRAHKKPIPVYVATNLLESMVLIPAPTRAEVNDIANTLLDGANGLVLAAETAVGKFPIACVSMVQKLIEQHEQDQKNQFVFRQVQEKSIQENEDFSDYSLLPSQTKEIFSHFGWKKVAALCFGELDNDILKFIHDLLSERSDLDGFLLNLVLFKSLSRGKKIKSNIVRYKNIISRQGLSDKVLINEILIDGYDLGRDELLGLAQRCKNYGCSHFILQERVANSPKINKSLDISELLKEIKKFKIEPICFKSEKSLKIRGKTLDER